MKDLVDEIDNILCENDAEYKQKNLTHYFYDKKNGIKLFNEDSLRFLRSVPSNCVDLVFADPPYFGNQSNLVIKRTDGINRTFDTKKAKWAFSKKLAYQFDFHYAWLKEVKRILKKEGTIWITGTYHSIGVVNVVLQDLNYKLINEIILHKKNAPPNFKGTCFRAVTENMIWAKGSTAGKKKFNYWTMKELNGGTQMSNLWSYTAVKNPFKFPATKQPFVMERVILAGSNENDIILDPFAGSGTTGYMAKKLNRKCILIEINNEYCKLIEDRINGKFD